MNSLIRKTASFDVDAQKSFTPLCPDELPVPDAVSYTHLTLPTIYSV